MGDSTYIVRLAHPQGRLVGLLTPREAVAPKIGTVITVNDGRWEIVEVVHPSQGETILVVRPTAIRALSIGKP